MSITAPRGSAWGDCTLCTHLRADWRCAAPHHYATAVPVDQARAPAGWPYRDASLPAPTLDLNRPYSTGGACGPRARLLETAK